MTFPCTKCGACCRVAFLIPGFTEPVNDNGSCVHLQDNMCSIYETRPDICRVDEYYDKHLTNVMSREEAYLANAQVCNMTQRLLNIDEKYRVEI